MATFIRKIMLLPTTTFTVKYSKCMPKYCNWLDANTQRFWHDDKSVFFLFEEKAQLFPEAQLYG